jgi:hypothetical protein
MAAGEMPKGERAMTQSKFVWGAVVVAMVIVGSVRAIVMHNARNVRTAR